LLDFQFAAVVFGHLRQRGGRIGDFICIQFAVTVGVQQCHDRRPASSATAHARTAGAARSTRPRACALRARRAVLRLIAAAAAGRASWSTAKSTGATAWSTPASASRAEELFHRQFSCVVFIKRFERGGGVGDFIGGKDTVVVCVKRRNDRRGRRPSAASTARTLARSALIWRWIILSHQCARGQSQQQRHHHPWFCFHIVFGFCRFPRRHFSRDRNQRFLRSIDSCGVKGMFAPRMKIVKDV
jgi:hypothetical protein